LLLVSRDVSLLVFLSFGFSSRERSFFSSLLLLHEVTVFLWRPFGIEDRRISPLSLSPSFFFFSLLGPRLVPNGCLLFISGSLAFFFFLYVGCTFSVVGFVIFLSRSPPVFPPCGGLLVKPLFFIFSPLSHGTFRKGLFCPVPCSPSFLFSLPAFLEPLSAPYFFLVQCKIPLGSPSKTFFPLGRARHPFTVSYSVFPPDFSLLMSGF